VYKGNLIQSLTESADRALSRSPRVPVPIQSPRTGEVEILELLNHNRECDRRASELADPDHLTRWAVIMAVAAAGYMVGYLAWNILNGWR